MFISPSCYFFVEAGGITQSVDQAFGPVFGEEEKKFRVTSKFSVATPVKAISICKGVVLIQPQTGSDSLVNLILRPYRQPFPGLNIKYFIYRGLRKSDFFGNGGENPVIPKVANVTSDLVDKINDDFDNFYSEQILDKQGNVIPKPELVGKFIGYDVDVNDTTLISDYFFKKSITIENDDGTKDENDAFELPLIEEGKSLGFFETGEGGFDVVLNYGDYKHDFDNGDFDFNLAYARSIDSTISPSGTEYEKKLQKEQSIQFIDIAAFYGLFCNSEGAISIYDSGNFSKLKGREIYEKVISAFITKNNWYIYIQSDRGRSYDFYGNYTIEEGTLNNIKIGIDENSLNENVFGTFGWPLLINQQRQASTDKKNRLCIQLVTDNNDNVSIYGQLGIIENAQKNNFCDAGNLRKPLSDIGLYSSLTKSLVLFTAATDNDENIATISSILYRGVIYKYIVGESQDEDYQTINVYTQPNYFDDIFDLIKPIPLLKSTNFQGFSRITSEKLSLISHFSDNTQQGVSLIQTKAIYDNVSTDDTNNPTMSRVTYATETVAIFTDTISANNALTNDTQTSSSVSKSINFDESMSLSYPYYYSIEKFTDGSDIVVGLTLKTEDGGEPCKVLLGLSKIENDALKALINNSIKNPRIYLFPQFSYKNKLISNEGIQYGKYHVGIVAEEGFSLKLFETNNPIIVYSIDKSCYFSSDYSKYMKLTETKRKNITINKFPNE